MTILKNLAATLLVLLGSWNTRVFGQLECAAPGNLRGIRVDGELMAFSTSIRVSIPRRRTKARADAAGVVMDSFHAMAMH